MRFFRSVRTASIVFVFFIMFLASALTVALIWLLKWLHILPAMIITGTAVPFLYLSVSVIIGMLISVIITARLLYPIHQLIDATKTIAKGDFSVRVKSDGEIGEICDLMNSFNLMAEELGSIEMFRTDFINTFSHEFKTPIVSIRGFARQLSKADITDEQRREYAEIIVMESEQLAKMSANVLLLSKLEHQSIISDQAIFSLDEQIRNNILLLESSWEKKNLEIDPDLSEVSYYGNAEILSHLWMNILTNAVKFTPEGGKISVRLSQDEKNVNVVVRDNGIGMSPETLSHVFEKFYQGDSSHSGQGNGLGMALVKRIVELCNGSVSIESEEGKGTAVYVSLPKNKPVLNEQS